MTNNKPVVPTVQRMIGQFVYPQKSKTRSWRKKPTVSCGGAEAAERWMATPKGGNACIAIACVASPIVSVCIRCWAFRVSVVFVGLSA